MRTSLDNKQGTSTDMIMYGYPRKKTKIRVFYRLSLVSIHTKIRYTCGLETCQVMVSHIIIERVSLPCYSYTKVHSNNSRSVGIVGVDFVSLSCLVGKIRNCISVTTSMTSAKHNVNTHYKLVMARTAEEILLTKVGANVF